MMRSSGEIERDANIVKSMRRIADALEKIGNTLAEIGGKNKTPDIILDRMPETEKENAK